MHHVGQMSYPNIQSFKRYIQISQFFWFTHTIAHTSYAHEKIYNKFSPDTNDHTL